MRKLMITAFIANIVLMLMSLFLLPERVVIHFSSGGVPDAWASKWVNVLIFLVIEIPLFALFITATRFTLSVPEKWLSLPNKDYWLKQENRAELETRFGSLMHEFGFALFAFLFIVGLLTMDANLSDPVRLNETVFLAFFLVFMLYVPYWLFKVFRRLRVPR